jgi:hypothetical protein
LADTGSPGSRLTAVDLNETCGPDQPSGSSPGRRGRRRRAASLVGCSGGILADGMRREAAASSGSLAGSPASWLDGDWWLERVRRRCAPVDSGEELLRPWDSARGEKVRGRAIGRGKQDGVKRGHGRSFTTGLRCSQDLFRRGRFGAPWRLGFGKRKKKGEEEDGGDFIGAFACERG